MNNTIIYFYVNNRLYTSDGCSVTLQLLPPETTAEEYIRAAGMEPQQPAPDILRTLTKFTEEATQAAGRADYLETIKAKPRGRMRIYIDENGTPAAFNDKFFRGLIKRPNRYNFFNSFTNNCIALFYNDILIAAILPVRLTNPAAALEAAEEEKKRKAEKKAAKKAKAAAFAAII